LSRKGQVEARHEARPANSYLSAELAKGALPLATALDWAADVASELREMHCAGRYHGAVAAHRVILTSVGAILISPHEFLEQACETGDVTAFGALLYEMVTGLKPDAESDVMPPMAAVPCQGPEGIRRAAIRLALSCLEESQKPRLTMQQMVTELRLFRVLERQWDTVVPAPPPFEPSPRPARNPEPVYAPVALTFPAEHFLVAEDEATKPSPARLECPRCGGFFVHSSQPRTSVERLLEVLQFRWRRCHRCYYRYGTFGRFFFCKDSPLQ
jgi:hypothetical protein